MPEPEETQQAQITDASAWRSPRKEGLVVKLPSGNSCRVRRTLDLFTLLKTGQIPNPLRTLIRKSIEEHGKDQPMQLEGLTEESLQQMMELIDNCVIKAVVEPPVRVPPEDESDPSGWLPPEGCISIYDLTLPDKMFIFDVAQGAAMDLQPFREKQEQAIQSVRNGAGVPSAAELASRSGG